MELKEPVTGMGQASHAFGRGPGMDISAAFFTEHVAPLADARLGTNRYAAALMGGGSDVLGLDTDMSADHDWGPRVTLFVSDEGIDDAKSIGPDLPPVFRGVSRQFGSAADGASWIHPFEVVTVADFFDAWVGFHDDEGATVFDWLATPAMAFLAVTAGVVFHDGTGELTNARRAAHWYPDDIWRWLVACQWRRIGEEQAFVGRAAGVGDRLGAAIIAARLAREAIRLSFLLERRYAPYSKWLGSAFATLGSAAELTPPLTAALDASAPDALCDVLEILGAMTNERFGLEVDPRRRQYYERPVHVCPAGDFTEALVDTVFDAEVRRLPTDAGNVDMLFGTNNGAFPGARSAFAEIIGTTGQR